MRYEHNLITGEVIELPDLEPTPVPPPSIKDEIAAIEALITPRRLREAVISAEGAAWLAAKDAEIAVLRSKL